MGGLGGLGGVSDTGGFFQRPVVQDTLNAVFDSMISSPRNNIMQNFAQSYDKSLQRRDDAEQRAAFEQALISAGMDPAQAKMMAASPSAAKFTLEQQQQQREQEAAQAQRGQTYDFFAQNDPELAQMMDAGLPARDAFEIYTKKRQGGGGEEYGLNPQYGVDANGNPVLIQLGKGGTSIQTPLPEGVTLSKEPIKLDAKTHWVLLDPITRQQIGIIPKETYEEAAQSASGSAAGKAQAEAGIALPGAADLAAKISKQVDGLKNDPYLKDMLGPLNSRLPNVTSDAARVQGKMDQIAGGAFLQGREMLKGGGAITDFESTKAEAAFVRMNAAQNEADFKMALDEFNDAVQQGVRKLEAQARGQSSTGGAPSTGASPYKDRYGLE